MLPKAGKYLILLLGNWAAPSWASSAESCSPPSVAQSCRASLSSGSSSWSTKHRTSLGAEEKSQAPARSVSIPRGRNVVHIFL